uniref:Uncharacterized protein n=1 Tax=Moniliophthora roreri TaxID=221103 RepID=A0A0W0FF20_MONRR
MPIIPPSAPHLPTALITPFTPPAHDPNAMKVNDTGSRMDWTHMIAMSVVPSSTPRQMATTNVRSVVTMVELVIMKWFALTMEVPSLLSPESLSTSSPLPPNINNMLAQLNQLSAQFTALKQSF